MTNDPDTLPFLALQRRAVILLVPGADELLGIDQYEWLVKHEVTCLFDGGLVMGGLLLPGDVRVSDELMHSKDFFALENCTLGLDSDGEPLMDAESIVFVQADALLGVAELNR